VFVRQRKYFENKLRKTIHIEKKNTAIKEWLQIRSGRGLMADAVEVLRRNLSITDSISGKTSKKW
jgi:hypothetical protein